jgi:hypothetical protein
LEAEKHIRTREEFDLMDANLPAQITLGVHEQDVTDTTTGAVVIQYGIFYCCKAQLLGCALYMNECRHLGLGVVLNSDFTFNMTKERYTHGSIGGRSIVRQGDFMVHKYRPFVFALTCRESESSYQGMIVSLQGAMKGLLDIDFDFNICIIDHCQGALNAIKGDVDCTNPRKAALCVPHIIRQAVEGQLKKMKDPGFHVTAQGHLWLLHKCRSEAMFDAIAEKVVEFWISSNEGELAQWLKEVYLQEDFKHWFVTATGAHFHPNLETFFI